jgi:hypothetical protein
MVGTVIPNRPCCSKPDTLNTHRGDQGTSRPTLKTKRAGGKPPARHRKPRGFLLGRLQPQELTIPVGVDAKDLFLGSGRCTGLIPGRHAIDQIGIDTTSSTRCRCSLYTNSLKTSGGLTWTYPHPYPSTAQEPLDAETCVRYRY